MKIFAYLTINVYSGSYAKHCILATKRDNGGLVMNKVIVFGASGFIGSHVAQAFINAGMRPTLVLRSGSESSYLQDLGGQIVIQQDFSLAALAKLLGGHGLVVNCIANVHPHQSLQQYNAVNVELTETITRAAARAGCQRLLQLSSVEVYGGSSVKPLQEEDSCKPRFDFQRSLFIREQRLRELATESGMDITIVRPSATFGPRSAFMKMLVGSLSTGQFPILGDGEQVSSAVDTRDIGRAFVFLAQTELAGFQLFNLAAYTFSMQALKSGLQEHLQTPLSYRRMPLGLAKVLAKVLVSVLPYGRIPLLTPFIVHASSSSLMIDDSKLRELGFVPAYNFEDTLGYLVSSYPQLSKMGQVQYA